MKELLKVEELEERIAPSGMGDTADNNNPGSNNTNLAGNEGGGGNPGNNNPGSNNTNLSGDQP
jgi:hypothetical protein